MAARRIISARGTLQLQQLPLPRNRARARRCATRPSRDGCRPKTIPSCRRAALLEKGARSKLPGSLKASGSPPAAGTLEMPPAGKNVKKMVSSEIECFPATLSWSALRSTRRGGINLTGGLGVRLFMTKHFFVAPELVSVWFPCYVQRLLSAMPFDDRLHAQQQSDPDPEAI